MKRITVVLLFLFAGCGSTPISRVPQTTPPLDQYLASDCKPIGPVPNTNDFDILLNWITDTVFVNYGDCAIRHRKTVDAWPK